MRIVGGKSRGHTLAAPSSQAIRPTSDRLRESLFNILEHGHGDPVPGARVLDLFAGTGALGFEAMSRGAATCLFVDDGVEARGLIRRNQESLGLIAATRLYRRDARRMGPLGTAGPPYGLAFLDPPYGHGHADAALASLVAGGWLAPEALVVVEESARAAVELPAGIVTLDRRVVGDTQLLICRFAAGSPP